MTGSSAKREAGSGRSDQLSERPAGRASAPLSLVTKIALAGLAALVVVAAALLAPRLLRRMAYFRVRRIEIVGAHYVAPSDILSRLHVDTVSSIWDPTKSLAERIASYPDIATATVERKLPGTLV